MDLFSVEKENNNLLPKDGELYYYNNLYNNDLSHHYFNQLKNNISWKNDEVIIFGKHIITNRMTAWYADFPMEYTYSKITRRANLWNSDLLKIKSEVENKTKEKFNACLLNLYNDGNDSMAWHSDDEKEIVENSCIASLSFGAVRKFVFKHKNTKEKVEIYLENGSLLSMGKLTQKYWLHALPKSKKIKKPRINLTFRKMIVK